MRPTARAALLPWLAQFEGSVPWMYLDRLGLVTTGIGVKIDSPTQALAIQWTWRATGAPAAPSAVQAEWTRVKSLQASRLFGGGAGGPFDSSARLVAVPTSLEAYTLAVMAELEATLRTPAHVGPAWDTLPSVAQVARTRTAWADGAASPWPKLDAALARGDWATAAEESQPSDLAVQPAAYRRSYAAVRALYEMAPQYDADALPDPMPDGTMPLGRV